jgi:hypothetical protein
VKTTLPTIRLSDAFVLFPVLFDQEVKSRFFVAMLLRMTPLIKAGC